jgi:diaminohydroxyphosphoribosylaminopyrimidine deaminase/5-amino-6-(5-phosphoribosylamino)uracil reductase
VRVLTGVGTVLHDDPQLTVRDVATPRQPLRVIVDRYGDTPRDARVLAGGQRADRDGGRARAAGFGPA